MIRVEVHGEIRVRTAPQFLLGDFQSPRRAYLSEVGAGRDPDRVPNFPWALVIVDLDHIATWDDVLSQHKP